MSTKAIKAILFDMDGVLIDAKEWHYEALNKALAIFGLGISRDAHLTRFDGLPTKTKLAMLSQECSLPLELHAFINDLKQRYTMDAIALYCRPVFCHEFALRKFHEDGYKIAVCSNSIRESIVTMMAKAYLGDYIDVIFSNEDVGQPKPHPEIYLSAIKYFNLEPDECLIVEDNENGIRAAKASGGHLLVVNNVNQTNWTNISNKIIEIENHNSEVLM